MGLQKKEDLSYQIKGKVHLDAGALTPSAIPFTSEGRLSFDGLSDSMRLIQ